MKQIAVLTSLAIVLLIGIFLYQSMTFNDKRLHVVFCNVGQGDAIFIRTPGQRHILVDGGPDKRVLDCLGKYLPFWERRLDLLVLSHPHLDHYVGFLYVLERYSTMGLATEDLVNPSGGFAEFATRVGMAHLPMKKVWQSDSFRLSDGVSLRFLGPTREFLRQTSPDGKIGNTGEFASLLTLVSFGSFDVLLTGDSQAKEMKEAADLWGKPVVILQEPHHGSASGISKEVLEKFSPRGVVISVGKNNIYGHPKKEVLDLLAEERIPVVRTDRHGDVEIVSDGEKWWVK